MSSIRLLIADDRSVTRSGLAALASGSPDLAVAGEVQDAEATLRAVVELAPDVVLLNLRDLPVHELPQLVRGIDGAAVIVLRSAGADVGLRAAIEADVAGYADLDALEGELAEIIGIVSRGCSVFVASDRSLSSTAFVSNRGRSADVGAERMGALTQREREVLAWISSGASNRLIASTLHLSESTIKKHATRILRKLSVTSRLEAAIIYREAVEGTPAQSVNEGQGQVEFKPLG